LIQRNIYNFLISAEDSNEKSTLIDYVDPASIGYVDVNVNAEYPRVTYNIISNPELYQTSDKWQRWRFYVSAQDKFLCKEIGDTLTEKLNNCYGLIDGVYFDYIVKLDESPITKSDDQIYEMYIDFRVLYHM
jgi:hypothetical protein